MVFPPVYIFKKTPPPIKDFTALHPEIDYLLKPIENPFINGALYQALVALWTCFIDGMKASNRYSLPYYAQSWLGSLRFYCKKYIEDKRRSDAMRLNISVHGIVGASLNYTLDDSLSYLNNDRLSLLTVALIKKRDPHGIMFK